MSDSEEKRKYDIVPLDKSNIESAAAVTGGILGLVLAGPIGGIALAAIVNYVSKKDNEAGEAFRGVGKVVIDSINYLRKLDSKLDVTGKVTETVASTVSTVGAESETVEKVKKSLTTAVSKAKEINEEYDLVAKSKEVIGIASTLSDAALEKVDELNRKVLVSFL
jgi:hypothetical protein